MYETTHMTYFKQNAGKNLQSMEVYILELFLLSTVSRYRQKH